MCDINLRQNFYSTAVVTRSLEYADMLKLNDDELPLVAKLLNISGNTRHMLNSLIDQYRLKLAVLTRGGNGSLLVSPDGYSDHPGVPIDNLQDTIGAGDAFTASTLINLLAGEDLNTINDKANRLAAKVCSHKGAMPLL